MSEQNLSPRQKMINMMYLVLMAMLAMNVQKEVLNAFVNVDEGLTETIENFSHKNELLYKDIAQQAAVNPDKALKWQKKAEKVTTKSDSLVDFMQDLKIELIKQGDGPEAAAIKGQEIRADKIKNKSNMDVSPNVMVGPNQNGKADDLRKAIESYKKYLLSLVNPSDSGIYNSLEENLDTSDPPPKEGQTPTWQIENFDGVPLIGATTILSGLQADIRNAESDVLNYLFNQIDEGAFKFNKIEPTVVPNSNHVVKGNEFNAQVFLAARDTTEPPIVLVGDYREVKEGGDVHYEMTGSYDSLPVKNGRGVYKMPARRTGMTEWGGIIKLLLPDGSYISRPFKHQYQVLEPSVVISPTKMNVFYLGVDNPVKIEMAGVPSDKIRPRISNGTIRRRGGSYVVRPNKTGKSVVSVAAEMDGQVRRMGSMDFRVKEVPDPNPVLGGKTSGTIRKEMLLALDGIYADMGEYFDFDLDFDVVSFSVSTTDKAGFSLEEESQSSQFTQAQKDLFKDLNRNQKFYIDDIIAVGPDGKERRLSPMSFDVY